MIRTTFLTIVTMIAFAVSAAASTLTDSYSSFWVFGDSLSDTGNLYAATAGTQPPAPYYNGRFSNGPIWADLVGGAFQAAGRVTGNFAYGGATAVTNADAVPDFDAQRAIFGATVPGAALGPRPLASVFFGANDLFAAIGAFATSPTALSDVAAAAVSAAQAVGSGIQALAQTGIRDFAVWNLPDLGKTPYLSLFSPPGVSTLGSYATGVFNGALSQVAAGLGASGLGVSMIDTFSLMNAAASDPGHFGFSNATLPCLFPSPAVAQSFERPVLCSSEVAASLLFFDGVHPTAKGQIALAETFAASVAIAAVPLPLTALLLLAALGMLFGRRRFG
jgi:outer membrane lipase/esterase